MIVIEVGADLGTDTLKYAVDKKAEIVYSFEPHPKSYKDLILKLKNLDNIKLYNKAVSNFNGIGKFNIDNKPYNSSLNELSDFSKKNKLIEYNNSIEVDVIRMDTFINENNIKKIDYLHCDAQGSDLDVLKSFGDKISILEAGQVEVSVSDNIYDKINDYKTVKNYLSECGFSNFYLKPYEGFDSDLFFSRNKKTDLSLRR